MESSVNWFLQLYQFCRLWIKMQRWKVRWILPRSLGEKWGSLLLLEHNCAELEWRRRFLQEGGRSSGVGHLGDDKCICFEWAQRKRELHALDRRDLQRDKGCLEMDRRLHSDEVHMLAKESAQQSWRTRLPSLQQNRKQWKHFHKQKHKRAKVEWLGVQSQTEVLVQPEALSR